MTTVAENGIGVTSGGPSLEANEFHVAEVPPGRAIRLGDVAVFNVNGTLYATQARCTHMGGPLCQGKLEGSTVTCPFHGAQFNVSTGALLRGPAQKALEIYPVRVEGGVGRIELGLEE